MNGESQPSPYIFVNEYMEPYSIGGIKNGYRQVRFIFDCDPRLAGRTRLAIFKGEVWRDDIKLEDYEVVIQQHLPRNTFLEWLNTIHAHINAEGSIPMIITDKGEFENFAMLRYAYLMAHQGNPPISQYFNQDEWEDQTLHISELGKCPRKQMYRLLGAEKKKRDPLAVANDELMFWQGNIIHALTVGAAYWSGIAVSHEKSLPGLPGGWSGHYDLIYKDNNGSKICWDGKTVRPNAFDYAYDWPKPEEKAQMQGYLRFLDCWIGQVEHIDRGGSNPPQISNIGPNTLWVDRRMEDLSVMRIQAMENDELPPILPWEFKLTYRKESGSPRHKWANVWYQPQWQCGWCDYLHGLEDKRSGEWWIHPESPCQPLMKPKILIAKNLKGGMVWENKEHVDEVRAWLETQLLEWFEPEEDVDSGD